VLKITLSRWMPIGLIGGIVLLVGCQANLSPKPTELDNAQFMSLWKIYSACGSASDLRQASSGMQRLLEAAALTSTGKNSDGFVLPLPSQFEQLISRPPKRLAVDVYAMTAACSIHAGELALHEGSVEFARDTFASVLTLDESVPPYYIYQAKRFLTELERGFTVSVNIR